MRPGCQLESPTRVAWALNVLVVETTAAPFTRQLMPPADSVHASTSPAAGCTAALAVSGGSASALPWICCSWYGPDCQRPNRQKLAPSEARTTSHSSGAGTATRTDTTPSATPLSATARAYPAAGAAWPPDKPQAPDSCCHPWPVEAVPSAAASGRSKSSANRTAGSGSAPAASATEVARHTAANAAATLLASRCTIAWSAHAAPGRQRAYAESGTAAHETIRPACLTYGVR